MLQTKVEIAGFRAALPRAVIDIYDNDATDGTAAIAGAAGKRLTWLS